jgi:hypothetical protein
MSQEQDRERQEARLKTREARENDRRTRERSVSVFTSISCAVIDHAQVEGHAAQNRSRQVHSLPKRVTHFGTGLGGGVPIMNQDMQRAPEKVSLFGS